MDLNFFTNTITKISSLQTSDNKNKSNNSSNAQVQIQNGEQSTDKNHGQTNNNRVIYKESIIENEEDQHNPQEVIQLEYESILTNQRETNLNTSNSDNPSESYDSEQSSNSQSNEATTGEQFPMTVQNTTNSTQKNTKKTHNEELTLCLDSDCLKIMPLDQECLKNSFFKTIKDTSFNECIYKEAPIIQNVEHKIIHCFHLTCNYF